MQAGEAPSEFREIPRHRPEWRRALRALRGLLADSSRTELAFEVGLALDGDGAQIALSRILTHPEGRALHRERPSLAAALTDRAALAQLPQGSLGQAYLDHLARYGLEPFKLVELGRSTGATNTDPDLRWAVERRQMSHDLFHVLAGYGAHGKGEAALLAFSLGQTGGRSNTLLTTGASLHMLRNHGLGWLPTVWESWRRGRRAVRLAPIRFEELLSRPLEEVRALLGILPLKHTTANALAASETPVRDSQRAA